MNPLAWAIENMRQARDKSLGVDPGVTPSRARIIAPPRPPAPQRMSVEEGTMRFLHEYPTPEDFYGAMDEYYGGPGDDVLRGGGEVDINAIIATNKQRLRDMQDEDARGRIASELADTKAKLAANYVDEPTPEVAAMMQRNTDFDARGGDLPNTFYRPPGRELGLPEMTRFAGRDQGDRLAAQNTRAAAAERLQAMQGASNAPLTHQDLADRDRMLAVSVPGQGVELSKAATGTTPGDIGYRDKRTSVERDEDRRLARMRKHGRMMDVNPLLVPFWQGAQGGDEVAGAMFAGGVGMNPIVPAAMADAVKARNQGANDVDRNRILEDDLGFRRQQQADEHAEKMAAVNAGSGPNWLEEAILRTLDPTNPPTSAQDAERRNELARRLMEMQERQRGVPPAVNPEGVVDDQQKLDAMNPPGVAPLPLPEVAFDPYSDEEDAMLRRVFDAKSKPDAWYRGFNDYTLEDFVADAKAAGLSEEAAIEWAKKNLANAAGEGDPDPRLQTNRKKVKHSLDAASRAGALPMGF